jgi:hypothetical protein
VRPAVDARAEAAATVLLVADDREGMVGTLAPAERAQAVAGANPGFVAALVRCCEPSLVFNALRTAEAAPTTRATQPLDWLDWEERKQRRLLDMIVSKGES